MLMTEKSKTNRQIHHQTPSNQSRRTPNIPLSLLMRVSQRALVMYSPSSLIHPPSLSDEKELGDQRLGPDLYTAITPAPGLMESQVPTKCQPTAKILGGGFLEHIQNEAQARSPLTKSRPIFTREKQKKKQGNRGVCNAANLFLHYLFSPTK